MAGKVIPFHLAKPRKASGSDFALTFAEGYLAALHELEHEIRFITLGPDKTAMERALGVEATLGRRIDTIEEQIKRAKEHGRARH